VASADDGEALSINPAGLSKSHGWGFTLSTTFITYAMDFTRRGTYDPVVSDAQGYEGTPYPTVTNEAKPPLGIGRFQPLPVIAVIGDLGRLVPGLHVALGLFVPNSYPFRDMTNGYPLERFAEDTGIAPPPSRYDSLTAESAALFPSIALAYRVLPSLDVGARFSAGRANAKQTIAVWGTPGNVDERLRDDTLFTADVADPFIPTFGVGVAFRPFPALELAAVYNAPVNLRLEGTGRSVKGAGVDTERQVGPIPVDLDVGTRPRCRTGDEFEVGELTPACIALQLPQMATIAARYQWLDPQGRVTADLELDVGWENWGKSCDFSTAGIVRDPDCISASQILVNLDAGLYVDGEFAQPLEVNSVNLGLRDVYNVRLGGSYVIPLDSGAADPAGWPNRVILRGGIGYDTAAARTGWLRSSFDGAARLTTTLGLGFKTPSWGIDLGAGYVHEGSPSNPGASPDGSDCNPTSSQLHCTGADADRPLDQRQGPDPTNPLLTPDFQFENPVNQGTYRAHYLLFMLGVSRWF
jgi:long-subunit fatty acid transport protein